MFAFSEQQIKIYNSHIIASPIGSKDVKKYVALSKYSALW